ncbi:MAG: 2-hydroxyacyl-CoA dehydratase [Deltaproteobacteria bacterium]|nr:2-hydroxyacyl-CoA dehydratase [Deltaproteobacteria bacterium]
MKASRVEIQTLRLLKDINANHYEAAREAARQGRPVGYVSVFAPAELLLAMDIVSVYPENHAVFVQARKMTTEVVSPLERLGYQPGLCSYARCDMGSTFTGKSPVGGLPKPDFFLTTNAQCSTLTKWFERMSEHFGVPLFLIDVPFTGGKPDDQHCKVFVRSQIAELIGFLEEITGKSLDPENLSRVVEISNQTTRLWKEIIESAMHVPSPISVFDQFISMAPIVAQRGTMVALEFYQTLKAEIDDRVTRGIGVVDNEKYRLYWDSLPLWHELKWLSDLLVSFKACLVSTIYTLPWADFWLDPKDPVSSWVEQYVHYFDWHLDRRVELVVQLKEKYRLNGFIFHNDRSCKMFSTAIPEIRRIVQEKTGVAAYILEGDHGDPRFYSREQIEKGLTYYFEILRARG